MNFREYNTNHPFCCVMPVLTIRDTLLYWAYDKLLRPEGKLSMEFPLGKSVKFKFFFSIPTAFCFLSLDIDWL